MTINIPSERNQLPQGSCVLPSELENFELFTLDIHFIPLPPFLSLRPPTISDSQLTSSAASASAQQPPRTVSTSLNNSSSTNNNNNNAIMGDSNGRAAQRASSLESRSIDAYYKHLQRQSVEREEALELWADLFEL